MRTRFGESSDLLDYFVVLIDGHGNRDLLRFDDETEAQAFMADVDNWYEESTILQDLASDELDQLTKGV